MYKKMKFKRTKQLFIFVFVLVTGVVGGILFAFVSKGPDESLLSYFDQSQDIYESENSNLEQDAVLEQKFKEEQAKRAKEALQFDFNAENLLSLTNEERSKLRLPLLTLNAKLNASAQAKAVDMASRNYWTHNSPEGVQPWVYFTNQGYSYAKAGENLGCGFRGSPDLMRGWMNSPSHKENIVKPDFLEVGFGIVNAIDYDCGAFKKGKYTLVVQHLARPY